MLSSHVTNLPRSRSNCSGLRQSRRTFLRNVLRDVAIADDAEDDGVYEVAVAIVQMFERAEIADAQPFHQLIIPECRVVHALQLCFADGHINPPRPGGRVPLPWAAEDAGPDLSSGRARPAPPSGQAPHPLAIRGGRLTGSVVAMVALRRLRCSPGAAG